MSNRSKEIEKFIRELNSVILHLTVRFRHAVPELAMEAGLSPPQAMFMLLLYETDTATMGDISTTLGTTQGVATRMVDRLVEKGMVERKGDANDRRVVLVSLSRKGKTLARKMTDLHLQDLQRFIAGVSRKDREALLALLKRFNEQLSDEP